MDDSLSLVPLMEVFERAGACGLEADQKLWELLVDNGFQLRVTRIGQHSYGVDRHTEEYFFQMLAVKQRLRGRFRLGALAFELALEGELHVPPCLVKREVQRRLRTFAGLLQRNFARGSGIRSKEGAMTHNQVGKIATKFAARATHAIQDQPLKTWSFEGWRFWIARLFGIAHTYEDIRINVRPLGELLARWRYRRGWAGNTPADHRQARTSAQELTSLTADFRNVFVLDPKQNILFRAVVDADPTVVAELTPLAAHPTRTIIKAMHLIKSIFPIKTFWPGFWADVEYHFPAISVAMLLAYQHEPATQAVINDLREGKEPAQPMLELVSDVVSTLSGCKIDRESVTVDSQTN